MSGREHEILSQARRREARFVDAKDTLHAHGSATALAIETAVVEPAQ